MEDEANALEERGGGFDEVEGREEKLKVEGSVGDWDGGPKELKAE